MAKSKKIQGGGSYRLLGKDKDKRNVYEVTVSTGWNPVAKKYEKRARSVHGTLKDVVRTRDELMNEAANGILKNAESITFYDFAWTWYDKRKADGEVSTSTMNVNKYALRVLCDYIGGFKLKKITPLTVDGVYSQIREDRGVGGTTMHQIHITLNMVMKRAVNLGYIIANPLDRVKAPKSEKSERRSLDYEQAARLHRVIYAEARNALAAFQEKEQRREDRGAQGEARGYIRDVRPVSCVMATCIGLATGARRGEVLALTWRDVDLARKAIRIDKTFTSELELREPKTRAGIRTVAIDEVTAAALRRWKEIQRGMLAGIFRAQTADTPVCVDSKGERIDPHNFAKWWRAFRAENGFGDLKFHELRHTQATLLLAKGTDVKTVQTRLGHSSAAITLDMYAHAMPENDREAAGTMAAIFAQPAPSVRVVKSA